VANCVRTHSGIRLGALVGAGYGGDQMGRLLALRGWAIADCRGWDQMVIWRYRGVRSVQTSSTSGDQRPALYTWLTLGDEHDIASLKFGFMDNRGNQNEAGIWHTHFSTVGLVLHPHPRIDVPGAIPGWSSKGPRPAER